jgi:hypothetical protein
MIDARQRRRIETESLIIGYAMSRFDQEYLRSRGHSSWRSAYAEAAESLGLPEASFKNLRDEFDPLHDNVRVGWNMRPLRPDRERVVLDLRDVSDDGLKELVSRLLIGDREATSEVIDSLAISESVASGVAQRLLTGRLAEEFFLSHCEAIVGIPRRHIVDARNDCMGYDFAVSTKPEWAIEVKGLRGLKGDVLFTDREWREAKLRAAHYHAVFIGNLAAESPVARLVRNPYASLAPICTYQTTLAATWRTQVSLDAPNQTSTT